MYNPESLPRAWSWVCFGIGHCRRVLRYLAHAVRDVLNASCGTYFLCNCNLNNQTLYKHLFYLLSRLNMLICTMDCARFVKMPLLSPWAVWGGKVIYVAGLPAALSSGMSLLQHALPAATPGIPALAWNPL